MTTAVTMTTTTASVTVAVILVWRVAVVAVVIWQSVIFAILTMAMMLVGGRGGVALIDQFATMAAGFVAAIVLLAWLFA